MNVQTYLFFDGCCQQAIDLYKAAIGAELLHLTRFSDAPAALRAPKRDHLVFHATLRIGDTLLNLSDDPMQDKGAFGGFVLLLHLDSPDAVDSAAELLGRGGQIDMAAQEVFWAKRYAIVTDPFGVTWKLQFSD